MDILKSLIGRKLGLGAEGATGASKGRSPLISGGGFISGEHGNQFSHLAPSTVSWFDDFLGDVIADQYSLLEGTDSATSDAAILSGGIGGVLRMTTGDAGTGLAADQVEIVTALQWQASNGGLNFQTRIKLSAITTCWVFVGWTDSIALEAPIISAGSADTITTTATDAVGFMFDTRMATDNWWLVGVANDVDGTAVNSGVAPVANEYVTLRVEVDVNGKASFFINGVVRGSISGAVTPAADLTPVLSVGKTSVAASMTMDVDYLHTSMTRGAYGAAF